MFQCFWEEACYDQCWASLFLVEDEFYYPVQAFLGPTSKLESAGVFGDAWVLSWRILPARETKACPKSRIHCDEAAHGALIPFVGRGFFLPFCQYFSIGKTLVATHSCAKPTSSSHSSCHNLPKEEMSHRSCSQAPVRSAQLWNF